MVSSLSLLAVGHFLLALILSPLLLGIINRTKAWFGGRHGQPFLQLYYDLYKLLCKGAVYSSTTTWVFRLAPIVGLAVMLVLLLFVPVGKSSGIFSFSCDFVFLTYGLALIRFLSVLAALDTGSSFEGMGASREVQFALPAELVWLGGWSVLALGTGQLSLSGIFQTLTWPLSVDLLAGTVMVAVSWLVVLLTENARIPVDDPATHLELTMIHEVMVLDHGSVDLAFIHYGAALKLWLFSALLVSLTLPITTGWGCLDLGLLVLGVIFVAILVGVIESTMARLCLIRVPQLLVLALAIVLAAMVWMVQ